jgi:AraC-like DNA-binding protein
MNNLNLIQYRQFAPHKALQPFIQCYWSVCQHEAEALPDFSLHPDGGSGLIFNFGSDWQINNTPYKGTTVFSGPNLRSSNLQMTGNIRAIGIRFLPGMLSPFISASLADLPEHSTSAQYLFSNLPLDHIADQMSQLESTVNCIRLLEHHLMNQFDFPRNETRKLHQIRNSIQHLNSLQGRFNIAELASTIAIGQRQLERNFKHYVGISAKQYNKLIRVKYCRDLIRRSCDLPALNLANIAQQAGFHDQAHFNREFKSVVGISPGLFLREFSQKRP